MTARLALLLLSVLLTPLARTTALPTGCQGGMDAAEVGVCDCDAEYDLCWSGSSTSGCAGCVVSWTYMVTDTSTGNTLAIGNAHESASCGGSSARHYINCPCGGGNWVAFAMTCSSC